MVKNDEDDGILTIAAYETMPTTSQSINWIETYTYF